MKGDGSLKMRAAYWGYRGAAELATTLPEALGRALFRAAGRAAATMLPGIRATVAANQARVAGLEPDAALADAAAREAFELYARYWFDTFRLPAMSDEVVLSRMRIEGMEHVDAALAAGHGCIAVLPHMGNWDAPGRWLSINGYPIASVAEELRPARLFELFRRHREALGMKIIGLTKDSGAGTQLAALLRQNWIVALVADRDLSGRGIEVVMFGAPRRLPAGPAMLSLSTGAPLVPAVVYTTDDGWLARVMPPVRIEATGVRRRDAKELSRLIAAAFERAIAARPTDWHVFQPGWPS